MRELRAFRWLTAALVAAALAIFIPAHALIAHCDSDGDTPADGQIFRDARRLPPQPHHHAPHDHTHCSTCLLSANLGTISAIAISVPGAELLAVRSEAAPDAPCFAEVTPLLDSRGPPVRS